MISKKMKKHWLMQAYNRLPLGGKIALPIVGVFLVFAVLKTIKWAFWLGLIGLAAYLGLSAFLYFKDKKQ